MRWYKLYGKVNKGIVLILIILEVLYETAGVIKRVPRGVLILIILEVLYELETIFNFKKKWKVLILIILEVLYELSKKMAKEEVKVGLNPYYTGSTLWAGQVLLCMWQHCVLILIILEVLYESYNSIISNVVQLSLNPYYTGSTLWAL